MQGRQSRRVTQRRNGQRQPAGPAAMQYASESVSTKERRHALLAMVVLGPVFLGICVTYLVLAASQIL